MVADGMLLLLKMEAPYMASSDQLTVIHRPILGELPVNCLKSHFGSWPACWLPSVELHHSKDLAAILAVMSLLHAGS